MLNLYKFLGFLIIPLIMINLRIRVINGKEDKNRFRERYGITKFRRPKGKIIWIHAASVGEFKSASVIINNLSDNFKILVTTTTLSAAIYAKQKFGKKIIHQYAPFDVIFWINKFLNNWKPRLVIWIESDLWPNTLVRLRERKISSIFLNARISPKSYKKWQYIASYYRFITKTFDGIYAQSKNDLERIKKLTSINVEYIGNLKLTKKKDSLPNYDISENIKIMFASTHEKEESLIIPYLKNISKKFPYINFVIAPRHPERSNKIYELLKSQNLSVEYFSKIKSNTSNFIIIDSFGKMDEFYNKSDIVFLGGSLTNNGGHNPIEAAMANCAIITGPNVFNWQNLYEEMIEKNCCKMISQPKELEIEIIKLIKDKNHLKNIKNNALIFSKNVFFDEDKLLNLLNKKLEYNA